MISRKSSGNILITPSMSSPESACDIIIPIWNQRERTERCLESVLKESGPIRLILIDNGSEAPTRGYLREFAAHSPVPVQLVHNAENRGFIQAVNQGIRASRAPWVCLLNNDTVVTAGWLEEMIRVGESDPRIGLVNPTSNSLGFHAGKTPLETYARSLREQSGRWTELTTALGFCLLARRSLFDQVGLLDEAYGMGNFDDDDLSRRVREAGKLCVRAGGAYVYHEEKVSFRELPGWEKEFEENRRRFQRRWGKNLRVLMDLASVPSDQRETRLETAAQLAKEGHWVTLIVPRETPFSPLPTQAQITRIDVDSRFWRIQAGWRLLSKRKKPFTAVLTADPVWRRWLIRWSILHHARILEGTSSEGILNECRNLSRSP